MVYRSEGVYASLRYEAYLTWNEGSHVLDITAALDKAEVNVTKARYAAERRAQEGMPAILVQSLVDLQLSSRETVGSRLQQQPALLAKLREVSSSAVKTRSHLDEDLHALVVRYTFPLFGDGSIIDVFVTRERSVPIRRYLPFAPSKDYTGVVIYAQGKYPSWGEPGVTRSVTPALFPRIYDTDMQLVVDLARMDPVAVVEWGSVGYADTTDEVGYVERVGSDPLRVMARAVFGIASTDVVIPTKTARSLLVREGNRELLRAGRIVLIVDAQSSN